LTLTSDRLKSTEEVAMGDLIYIGITLGFFGLTWAFIRLCERV